MAEPILTRFVKGGPSGAIETELLAGGYLKTAVKSADGKKITFAFENPDETAGMVSFVGVGLGSIFEQTARVPNDQQTAIVYVPHDYVDGDPQAQVVTVGQVDEFGTLYRGFSHGDNAFEAFGAFAGRRAVDEIFGRVSEDGTTFTLSILTSFNVGFIRDISKVVINGVEYNVGPVTELEGAYQRTILEVAALPVATVDFTLNFVFADGENYYRNGAEVLHKAGLYLWNKDLVPPKYEFVGVNSRIIVTDTDPPLPSAENNGALVIAPNGVYQYYSEPVHRVEPVVGWAAYAANDYRGAYNSDDRIGDANDQPANSRFYNTSRRRFRVRSAIAGTGPDFIYRWVDTSNPPNSLYPFHFHSRDGAALHATAVGDIAFTGYRVEVVNAYAAAQPASTLYHSRRLLTAGEELNVIVHRAALPAAADANFDNVYGLGAEETDSLHFKRRSEVDELYLRADNLVASSFNTIEIVGFTTGNSILFHAGGAILPAPPAWLTGITQEFAIGGESYEVFLQTDGNGPVLPATDTVRMDVNVIGSNVVRTVFLASSPDGNAWTAVLNDRLFTAGVRYRIRLRLGDAGDDYIEIGTEDHISKIAGDHEVDELEGEVRAEVKAQRTAVDGEIRAKVDLDLQNVSAALSDSEQGTVRDRIGAASADQRGTIQTKGEIWATSPIIPDIPEANRVAGAGLPFAAGERWAVTQHAPVGVIGDVTDLLSHQLEGLPLVAPAGIEGLWIELLIDGVLVDDVRVPWGMYPVPSDTGGEFNATFLLKTADNRGIQVNLQVHLASPTHQLNLAQTGTSIPANTRIRVREARPSFPAISGTRPGDVIGPRVAHISSPEGSEVVLTNALELFAASFGDQIDGNAIWTIDDDAPAGFSALVEGDTPATITARLAVPRNRPADNVSGFIVRSYVRPTYGTLAATLPIAGLTRLQLNLQAAPLRPIAVGTKLRIEREIVEVTALTASANIFTIARAQDGTDETSHEVTANHNPRASGLDLELYDDADFEWGPGNIYHTNQAGGLNTALTPLKLDSDAMIHCRYVELSGEDSKYISLWGRSGRAPVGTRIEVHLKIDNALASDVVSGRESGLPVPAEDGSDDDKVGITNDGLYYIKRTPHPMVLPTGDWVAYAHDNYLGAFSYLPTVTESGVVIYHTGYHNWLRSLRGWTEIEWQSTNPPPGWVNGNFVSRQDALNHASDNGVFFTGTAVEVLSNFVAGADATIARRWFLPGGPGAGDTQASMQAQETDGVTSTGSGHFHFRFYRASPVEPTLRNDWTWGDNGFTRSPVEDLWNADREIVAQQNSDNHPIWILIGSATRAVNGNYSYSPWHIYAEFGSPLYSVDPDADSVARHPVRADTDNWLWLRDTDGQLVGPIPLTDRNYARQLLFNDYLYQSDPASPLNTKPFVRDLSSYDAIEIEIRPYVDYDIEPAASCSALLFRPATGFLVSHTTTHANRRYQVRAWDQAALKVLGGNAPVRDDDFTVSALGEYQIHFRFIFETENANSNDRFIRNIIAFDHGSLYNRARFLVWGINF